MRISHWWPNRPNLLKIAIAGFVYAGKQCWLTMIGNQKNGLVPHLPMAKQATIKFDNVTRVITLP
jgi:hypothetical protein